VKQDKKQNFKQGGEDDEVPTDQGQKKTRRKRQNIK
jgi:hypothetical protein